MPDPDGFDEAASSLPFMPPLNLVISRIGPESDTLLGNLFEHYCHDMSEWFEIDTGADGRYAHDTSSVWTDGHDVYLARVGDSIAGFALVDRLTSGLAKLVYMTFTSFLSCADFGAAESDRA